MATLHAEKAPIGSSEDVIKVRQLVRDHAVRLGYRKPTSMYNIACAYSMLEQRDLAFQWLDRAVEAGFNTDNYIESDRDLDNLRSDPRFRRFQIRAKGL